jgi:hypothetical protein
MKGRVLGEPDVYGMIILTYTLKQLVWTVWQWSGIAALADWSEHRNRMLNTK